MFIPSFNPIQTTNSPPCDPPHPQPIRNPRLIPHRFTCPGGPSQRDSNRHCSLVSESLYLAPSRIHRHAGKTVANRYLGHAGGSMIERRGDRQRKFDGLQKWPFRLFVESLPVMLQIAVLSLARGLRRYATPGCMCPYWYRSTVLHRNLHSRCIFIRLPVPNTSISPNAGFVDEVFTPLYRHLIHLGRDFSSFRCYLIPRNSFVGSRRMN